MTDPAIDPEVLRMRGDSRDWARRILARHQAGGKVNRSSLRFAYEALMLPVPKGLL